MSVADWMSYVTDPITLGAIAAVTGLIGAAGGLFAAVAAFRSAGAAKDAAKHAQEVDRRGVIREVSSVANSIVAETIRIDDVANTLKRAHQTQFAFSGRSGGGMPERLIGEIERKQKEVLPLQEEARGLLENKAALKNSSEEELGELLSKLEGYLVQVRRVKEKFAHELQMAERNNEIYREKAIKGK